MKLPLFRFSALTTGIVALLLLPGCGKKSDATAVETSPPETPAAVQPVQPAAAVTPAQTAAPDTRLAESQAAINSGDYERAASALVAAQQAHLNEQQAAAVTKQMQQLQGSLAAAVASGDPRAKAAADKLRQSSRGR